MKQKMIAVILATALAAAAGAAWAAEATVYADVLSAYVYRGQVGNDEAVFQPGLDVTGPLGLGASLWGSMNLTDNQSAWYPDSAGKWGELNVGLNWSQPVQESFQLTVGGLLFIYPQETSEIIILENGLTGASKAPADGGYEVFVELAADQLPLQPKFRLCHDLDDQEDWIALASIGHSLALADPFSLDLGATVGYAGKYYVADNYNGSDAGSAFTHVQLDAVLNYALTKQVTLGLKGSYSSILDSAIREDIRATIGGYPEVDIFYGGLTASLSF